MSETETKLTSHSRLSLSLICFYFLKPYFNWVFQIFLYQRKGKMNVTIKKRIVRYYKFRLIIVLKFHHYHRCLVCLFLFMVPIFGFLNIWNHYGGRLMEGDINVGKSHQLCSGEKLEKIWKKNSDICYYRNNLQLDISHSP